MKNLVPNGLGLDIDKLVNVIGHASSSRVITFDAGKPGAKA